jgi:SAM-dependent methyltransferase
MDGVAPDGSPVEVYLAVSPHPDVDRIREMLPVGCSVLDLGAGVGRLANPLAKAGHRVVAVDDSPEMLAHIDGPTPVLADIWSLHLGEHFDAVLALSHLINCTPRTHRVQLLHVCRRHLRYRGVLIVQRYPPTWVPTEGVSASGAVAIRLHDVVQHSGWFTASVTYALDDRSWTQHFDAATVGDEELGELAAQTGFEIGSALDDAGAWVTLTAVS